MARKAASSPSPALTRRQFGKQAACAGLATALAATPVLGQAEAPQTSQKQTAAGENGESRYLEIIRRYGERLSEEQRRRLRKILAYNEKLLAPIRAFPLENGQPAATVLKFYDDANAVSLTSAADGRVSNRNGKNGPC
ncbi:MAG: twin-arginine translocation signal domain-containing protein [Chlamydiota bacterium]